MIQRLELGDENVIAWRIEGKIDQADYAPVIRQLDNKMNSTDKLNVYLEIPKMEGITPQAVWESLKFGISNLKEFISKINKAAVVTDKQWLQTYTRLEDRLFKSIDERTFSMEEAEEARKWIKQ